ncbi:MAG TPA: extracellular solute-binding protein [Methylomusa anaerophila]|uniref:Fe(3+)-binding periplasmic protein n=1 Tax=Methylomusa anaerophila TaxID=1930071 RepID=A0A348APW4_9FIRM|nr:extracellular solute-binding protein [Methylomusa anaerophila]BBB93112.1 Fe(3+)-binding periplasmic protein precursor [Methylomusa anaerophila]HML87055.1 extracellular solute-binding protein [Methylomusa anaerophila]
MRRYLPLLMSFFLTILAFSVTTFLAGYAGRQPEQEIKNVNLYTTLPVEQIAVLAEEYGRTMNVKVNVTPLTERELLQRLQGDGQFQADVIITNRFIVKQARKYNLLESYASEQLDIIPSRFRDSESYWTGIWYDPVIFAVNQDYIKNNGRVPLKWSELYQNDKLRLAITDFLAAEASANLLYSLVSVQGEEQTLAYLKKIHPQIVQYSKFLVTPARMVSLGEVHLGITVQSEAKRYVNDGFPVKIFYPEEGTSYILTAAALVKGSPHNIEAKAFIEWLTQDRAQEVLIKNKFYFIPTNPETVTYQEYSEKNIKLIDYNDALSNEQQQKLLDKWVQTVRLGLK